MSLSVAAVRTPMSTMTRVLLLIAAIVVGFVTGLNWGSEISALAYESFIKLFADPNVQITSQAMGIGMALLLGFVHVTSICYLPAALAALPMVQTVRSSRDWLKTVAVLGLSMVIVSALFGVLISTPANVLAGIVGSRHLMSQIMKATIIPVGFLLVILAMGEMGLIRRLLPSAHLAPAPIDASAEMSPRARYRRAAWMGAWMAATFGVLCPKPLYVGLLVYVAVLGNPAYGALALGTYGLGLVASVAIAGLILLPTTRAAQFSKWLGAREEAFRFVQGLVFAAAGAMAVAFFWFKYVVVPA
jgi:cytochrome c biogenesis protein CcdA